MESEMKKAFENSCKWRGQPPIRDGDGYFPIDVHVAWLQFRKGYNAALKSRQNISEDTDRLSAGIKHAAGREEQRPRTPEEQAAVQNKRASEANLRSGKLDRRERNKNHDPDTDRRQYQGTRRALVSRLEQASLLRGE